MVEPTVSLQARAFSLNEVSLLDGPFKRAMELNAEWLLSLEPDRFLAWFRREAGLEPKGEAYGGWERDTIAGHSFGHYMSAIATMYAATGQEVWKERAAYIVNELAAVQRAHGDGYMSAFPGGRQALEEVSRGEIRSTSFHLNGIWAPWYTQHKLKAGLRDIYHYTGNDRALDVWIAHANWIDRLLANLTDEQWQRMLATEHGGIKETFIDLYTITGNRNYLALANRFYHRAVMDPLSERRDILPGLHANTQVPKVIAAARMYELTGQERYRTSAEFFWETVVNYHTFANGGNSAEEFFSTPGRLSERMHDTTEACNTYNMLKLTRHLFAWRPNAVYMDYYERAMLNHILAHQHPHEGGRLKYKGFLDMPARKGFSHPTESFWCCVGTGMESQARYAKTIYAYNADTLYVNLFVSSRLNWEEKGIVLTQKSQLPDGPFVVMTFDCRQPTPLTLKIRKPWWAENVTVALNGQAVDLAVGADGYMALARTFRDGDTVAVNMPMRLHTLPMPGMPNRTAFFYGPTLLSALLERGEFAPVLVADTTETVLEALERRSPREFVLSTLAMRKTPEGWRERHLTLVPHYAIAEEPYTVYMDMFTQQAWREEEVRHTAELERIRQLDAMSFDLLRLGQVQPERDRNLTDERSGIGTFGGRTWRHAFNGWFEFDMRVSPEEAVDLICTYWGSERGRRTFDILIDGERIATQVLDRNRPNEFFEVRYQIPIELTRGKESVRVRFQSSGNVGAVYEVRTVRRQTSCGESAGCSQGCSDERAEVDRKDYPYVPVCFTQVRFNDVFWAPRLETNRTVTIPHVFRMCEETRRFNHFERAAKVLRGEELEDRSPPGLAFDDTDVFKSVEAAAYVLSTNFCAELDAFIDGVIALIASAQEPDGYLYTTRTINPEQPHEWAGPRRWIYVTRLSHELYNAGHLIEAAVAHYQATGKRSLLEVAIRKADLIYNTFGPGRNEDAPGHQLIEMALVRLYRVTGDERYLRLARFFLDTRGPNDGEYSQAHKRVVDQYEAVGHAVRAAYMYSGMTDIAALTGDQAFVRALDSLWDSVVDKKFYVTGGLGATASGEAFGPNYVLPNMTAYAETCASIANIFWNHRMFLLHGDGKYIDVLERTLYNAMLASVSLDGTTFFYPNPLESRGQHRRTEWFHCACCPPNIARFLASLPGYVYAVREDALYVNLYIGGAGTVELENASVKIEQETRYPWDGQVNLTVTPDRAADFTINLRIPGWAMNRPVPSDLYSYMDTSEAQPRLQVNGQGVAIEPVNGYARLTRQWMPGDTIELYLPMPVRRVVAHPNVIENRDRFALERGPIVFCIEGVDNANGQVRNMIFDPAMTIRTEFRPDFLGGVQVLKFPGSVVGVNEQGQRAALSEVEVLAVPYHVWCNRGPNEMVVWLPTRVEDAFIIPPPSIASESSVTASPGSGRPSSVTFGIDPRSSHDKDNEFFHWWPRSGTSEWMQFEFREPTALSAIEVYWLDDRGQGACRVPQSWRLMYRDGGEWRQVVDSNGYGVERNMFNMTAFTQVTTEAVRIELQMQEGWSAGVLQVRFK